jgi:protein-S-isoprenylcysteine O-methyltransferase Ste14
MDEWPTWLIISIWIIWFVFWRLAARGSPQVVERESARSRASYLVPMLLVIVLLVGPGWPTWLARPIIPGGWIRDWKENWMTQAFGDRYREYRATSRSLVPFVFKEISEAADRALASQSSDCPRPAVPPASRTRKAPGQRL